MSVDASRAELRAVKEELELIEQQLEELLERQQHLYKRKSHLESVIKTSAVTPSTSTADKQKDKHWSGKDFKWTKELDEKRQSVFGIANFRPLQRQTMNATLSGKDCILIMPTGGGKSLCFQLPAVISKGVTLVVSPLVSLMEDQLIALKKFGVNAALLNAASTKEEVNTTQAAMLDHKSPLKLLYVTPEKLAKSKRFMAKLEKMYDAGRFARLVIDEVHCCSQWGHDFRPDYKFLGVMKRQFPGVAILGLTATATTSVISDVKKILAIPDSLLFRASFNRHNLYYEVIQKPSAGKETMKKIHEIITTRFRNQSGIVYCFSRKDTEDVAKELRSLGVTAGHYHADMHPVERSRIHTRWLSNNIQVVVATVAFGMGIDKPDVRFVIHHSLSKSMENYYQESGRAGRDDKPATCILFVNFGDMFRQSTMVFTEQTGLDNLYGMVRYAHDLSRCRRTIIAQHFGERWDSSQCNKMCDHCDDTRGEKIVKKDVSVLCKDVAAVLEYAAATSQRVTGLKVLDSWQGKGGTKLRVKSVKPPSTSRANLERILVYLLLEGYIREDFHFTPYSTISYIVQAQRLMLVTSGAKSVEIEFALPGRKETPKDTLPKTPSATTPATSSGPKVKPCIINTEKSAFVACPTKPTPSKESPAFSKMLDAGAEKKRTEQRRRIKKRKAVIESDDEELDFCESDSETPEKKQKMAANTKKAQSCIVIDDDSDDDFVDSKEKLNGVVSSVSRSLSVGKSVNGSVDTDEELYHAYTAQLKTLESDTTSPSHEGRTSFSKSFEVGASVKHDLDDSLSDDTT